MRTHDQECLDHEPSVCESGGEPVSESVEPQRGLVTRTMLGAIGLYRMTASVRTPRCRYIPSCSAYAAEAIEVHGPGRGLWLAIRRLGRCHPFGSFGFDPVPDKKPEK